MTCANASIFDLIDDIRKLNYQSELAIGRALDAAQSQTAEQSATITRLKEEIADFQSTFDLRWKADMRAIERWQKETGRKMVWPDHTDLLVWLMGKLEDKGGLQSSVSSVSNMKMVIVMRTDLKCRKGKLIAQGAHAAVLPFLTLASRSDCDSECACGSSQCPDPHMILGYKVSTWISESGMKKICVGIPSEPSLREIMEAARIAALDVWPVVDAGYTEFDGPTLTCAAIGPDEDERIDAITGGLKLL